jgi:hypothetical protein
MIHVVVMECLMIPFTILIGLPLLIYIELLYEGVRNLKTEKSGVGGFVY